jgi:hypothetical protein
VNVDHEQKPKNKAAHYQCSAMSDIGHTCLKVAQHPKQPQCDCGLQLNAF